MIQRFFGVKFYSALARSGVRNVSTAVDSKAIPTIDRPLGVEDLVGTNRDSRTTVQKIKDFVDYDKNLQRRQEIKTELATSRFTPMRRFGDVNGKFWQFPAAYSRAERSLYLPNITGITLVNKSDKASLTDVCRGNVSIVRLFSNTIADKQTLSYFPEDAFNIKENGFQVVHVNGVENYAKELLVRLAMSGIRKQFNDPLRWSRYIIARSSLTKEIRASLMAENVFGGYIYLVDRNCKIRWAACGEATPQERGNLWRYVKLLQNEKA